jgi:hypothetical protein
MPIVLASVMCVLPPSAVARSPGNQLGSQNPNRAVQTGVAVGSESGVPSHELTDAEREAFRLAQQSSDPGLGEQRGGGVGLLILLLLVVILILALR